MSEMNRIVVIGTSGSGKTTTARALARTLDVPHLEMDSVMHAGGWNATPDDEFRRILGDFASQERWVMDGNYTSHGSREAVWPRADTVVWSDVPRRVVMSRVIRRTLRRTLTQEELWDGVREPIANLYKFDPYENIVVWAWTRFDHVRNKYERAMTDGSWSHATVYRLRSKSEIEHFLDSLVVQPH